MSETKFTPGPWRAGKSIYQSQARVVAEKGGRVADVFAYEEDQAHANAALIAAAPEMFEALAEAVEKYGKSGGPWNVPSEPGSWIAKAKEALKKARGER